MQPPPYQACDSLCCHSYDLISSHMVGKFENPPTPKQRKHLDINRFDLYHHTAPASSTPHDTHKNKHNGRCGDVTDQPTLSHSRTHLNHIHIRKSPEPRHAIPTPFLFLSKRPHLQSGLSRAVGKEKREIRY